MPSRAPDDGARRNSSAFCNSAHSARVDCGRDRPPARTLEAVSTELPLSPRILAINESATLKVDAKAKALKASGRPVISYGAGEPDFSTPANIVDAARRALDDPGNFRYTPAAGLPDLRRAVVAKTQRDSGLTVDPAQVVITNGGKQAVYEAFAALVGEGDEVILPAPYWTTYPEAIRLAGGTPVEVFAGADQGYRVTVDQLEAARTERTRLVLFVSPSNPTGAVYTREQTEAIARWAVEHDIWILADEIYQNLTYDGVTATSIASVIPEAADNTVLVNGVAKTYAMTGWRVGWLVGPQRVAKAVSNLQSHLTSNVSNVSQRAAVEALTGPQDAVAEMRAAFDRRRRLIVDELSKIDGFVVPVPEGAFYAYPDVTGVLGREWHGVTPTTTLELADLLLDQTDVAVVPGEAFGRSGYLRLSYALDDESLLEGVHRLQRFFSVD
ncbi:pyridoxal phosphate-dependent aminotransferase [Pseudoclavibacter sp. CFCC 13611]|nr:pyridoxal phosphate-dependent aminotransferase [Pseudoclavibacter sp. CFCC 13611]